MGYSGGEMEFALILNFKPQRGDKVVAIHDSPWYKKGDKGTFVRESVPFAFGIKSQLPYLVDFEEHGKLWCYEKDIEKVNNSQYYDD